MPLVLICRAHTIALVTLITSVMVLIVKVRLTFSMTLSLSRQVLDRPSLNHCRSGGHFWPNKANWSSHKLFLKFAFFDALLKNAYLDILLSKNYE